MNSNDYHFDHVVHRLLQQLEQIDEDVALNLRIKDDATYMIFLEELNKTSKALISYELEYSKKAILWSNDWISGIEVSELYFTGVWFSKTSEINILNYFIRTTRFYWPKLFKKLFGSNIEEQIFSMIRSNQPQVIDIANILSYGLKNE